MFTLSGTPITSVERIPSHTAVRRVERDQSADDFSQRQQERPEDEPADEQAKDGAMPQDVVEVSSEYHPVNLPTHAVHVVKSVSYPAETAPPSRASERHIDITG